MQIESTGKKAAEQPPPLLPTFTTKKKKNKDFILFFCRIANRPQYFTRKVPTQYKKSKPEKSKNRKNTNSTAHGKNSKERNSSCEIYIENILLFFYVFVVSFFLRLLPFS